jgi:hypothetical protein
MSALPAVRAVRGNESPQEAFPDSHRAQAPAGTEYDRALLPGLRPDHPAPGCGRPTLFRLLRQYLKGNAVSGAKQAKVALIRC